MKTVLISCFALILALTIQSLTALAQTEIKVSENDIALLRRDLRTEKKKLIAVNMPLTEDEATKFWPVYDLYVADMKKWNDEFYSTVKQYSDNSKTWTDADATAMLDRWVKIQMEQAKTRQKYIPLIEKTIPAKKAALFFQIDRRLYVLMDLQVSTFLPLLAPPQ